MTELKFQSRFHRIVKKYVKKNNSLEPKILQSLQLLKKNQFHRKLKTHSVISSYDKKKAYSSSVTGDLRIIWEYENKQAKIIDIVDIGGHSGNKKVYS
jgi:mRNA-degrading endonuclease YafQ of YafQ-DinJ toxin-antitoxin module